MTDEQKREFLKEVQERLRMAIDDDKENRDLALEDLEFGHGNQWPELIKQERLAENRPCLTINKMPIFVDQVVGDQRMNRPMIKVLPVDSAADVKVAKILTGWVRHVQNISKSDIATDHAFEHAVYCGYGALRVVTRYSSDTAFEQEAYIVKIDNALAVFWGPHTEYDCSDAMYCIIISNITREDFKEKYNKEPMAFNSAADGYAEGWCDKDTVRIAEYFKKVPIKKKIYCLVDGRVVDKVEEGDQVVRERDVNTYKIMWYLVTGDDVIEEKEWAGKKYIPVIPVWGKELNIGGKRKIRGLIRHAKDAQRMYNYWQSTDTEVVALQPKVPYILTPKQIEGYEDQWKDAHKRNYPYLLSNPDKDAPGWPHRQDPPQVSSAMVEKIKESDQEMRDTVGLQKASLGMQSNERSGAAIRERKKEGDIGTYAFIDNLARSLEQVGRVLVDIAPTILDTQRRLRLGLENGEFTFESINVPAPDDSGKLIHDMAMGTYDVVVVVGPSFTTQRTEANESMREFIQYFPQAAPLIGDLYAKSMDWPGAEEVAERLEYLLPPEIRAKKAAAEAAKAGEPVPPPTELPAPPPNPELELKVKEAEIRVEQAKIQLRQEEERLKQMKIDSELKVVTAKDNVKKMLDEIKSEEEEARETSEKANKKSANKGG